MQRRKVVTVVKKGPQNHADGDAGVACVEKDLTRIGVLTAVRYALEPRINYADPKEQSSPLFQAALSGSLFIETRLEVTQKIKLWTGKIEEKTRSQSERWLVEADGNARKLDYFCLGRPYNKYCAIVLFSVTVAEARVRIRRRRDGKRIDPYQLISAQVHSDSEASESGGTRFSTFYKTDNTTVPIPVGPVVDGSLLSPNESTPSSEFAEPTSDDMSIESSIADGGSSKPFEMKNDHCGLVWISIAFVGGIPWPANFDWNVFKSYHSELFRSGSKKDSEGRDSGEDRLVLPPRSGSMPSVVEAGSQLAPVVEAQQGGKGADSSIVTADSGASELTSGIDAQGSRNDASVLGSSRKDVVDGSVKGG